MTNRELKAVRKQVDNLGEHTHTSTALRVMIKAIQFLMNKECKCGTSKNK